MNLKEALDLYQGSPLNMDSLSEYQQWALPFFHNEDIIKNPKLSMTLQLELSEARNCYEQSFQQVPNASFQAYLVWNLAKALAQEWTFSTREIEGQWYSFKNLPLYFTVAVGGPQRFKEVLINDVVTMDWASFSKAYRQSIDKENIKVGDIPPLTWAISHFIGNLPNLNFTSFQIHQGVMEAGRPTFYLGQRHQRHGKQMVPLSITFDHANSDPYVLDQLINTYQKLMTSPSVSGE